MNNDINKMDDLLVKYMLGETTSAENAEVEQWLALSENNQQYYQEMKTIWEKSLPEAELLSIDEEEAWKKLQERISHKPVVRKINSGSGYKQLFRIAAMFVVVCTIGFFIYRSTKDSAVMMSVSAINESRTDTLPDGTSIALNKNSSITYPDKFSKNTREVNLKGEAFFDVTPDKEKPFIIHTGQLNVRVVGTSFNVKEFNSDSTAVIVETGIVKVYSGADSVTLVKGEQAVFNNHTRSFRKQPGTNPYYDYYFSKTLVFENTELSEVVNVLNAIFDSKLVISKEQMNSCRLTATFKNESIDTIVHILKETFGLTVTEKAGQTYLSGNGCN